MLLSLRKFFVAASFFVVLASPPAQAVTPDELFEVLQRIESLENEVRFLRGENEQIRFDMEDIKKTQKRTFIRIDDRMDDLFRAVNTRKRSSVVPLAPASPLAKDIENLLPEVNTVAAAPQPAPRKPIVMKPIVLKPVVMKPVVLSPVKPAVRAPAPATALRKPAQPIERQPAVSPAEKQAYDAAFANIKAKPSAAISMFRQFLKRFPDSALAPNAQYWLGEVMFSSRNYQGAIDEFVTVLQSYGNSDRAPDAAIKLGLSFYEMKNWVYARRSLENVVRTYPRTKVAHQARARLVKMHKENLY